MNPPAPVGPSASLLNDMLSAANESSRLVTLQRDNLRMQLDGACRRVDELEATMAENAVQLQNFVVQSQHDANILMQTASSSNLEVGRKLSYYEREAEMMHAQLASSEQKLIEQHQREARYFVQNTQSELQQLKHYASTEQATATATSHALP